MLRYFIVLFFIFSLFAISRKKHIFAVVKHLNLNDMKKIFLGLLAIVGMVFFFTACGDDNNTGTPEQASATESGTSLYDSYTSYETYKNDSTTVGTVQKVAAAASLYKAYQAYNTNKDDSEWVQAFATSAVTTIAEGEKETAKTALISALSNNNIATETTSENVIQLADALAQIFG